MDIVRSWFARRRARRLAIAMRDALLPAQDRDPLAFCARSRSARADLDRAVEQMT